MRDDQTITVLVEKNPKKERTAAHHLFGLYENGQTVGAYKSAVRATANGRVALGLPARADQGRRALEWDLKRRYIRID